MISGISEDFLPSGRALILLDELILRLCKSGITLAAEEKVRL
jgi:hypothetical protein